MRAAYRRDFLPPVETTVTLSDSGIEFQNAKSHSSLGWNAFIRYTETKELFMLYVQSRIFQMSQSARLQRRIWRFSEGSSAEGQTDFRDRERKIMGVFACSDSLR